MDCRRSTIEWKFGKVQGYYGELKFPLRATRKLFPKSPTRRHTPSTHTNPSLRDSSSLLYLRKNKMWWGRSKADGNSNTSSTRRDTALWVGARTLLHRPHWRPPLLDRFWTPTVTWITDRARWSAETAAKCVLDAALASLPPLPAARRPRSGDRGVWCPRIAGIRCGSVESAWILVGTVLLCLGLWFWCGSTGGCFDLVDLSHASMWCS